MRRALLLIAACGGANEPNQPPLTDAEPQGMCQFWVCFDHTIWETKPQPVNSMGFCGPPDYNGVHEYAQCERGCRTSVPQNNGGMQVCVPPPLAPLLCQANGSCTQNDTQACVKPQGTCTPAITYGSCTCNQQAWSCTESCADGLCGPVAVQQALAGSWRGHVTRTTQQVAIYEVQIDIAANGDWKLTDIMTPGGQPPLSELWGGGTPGSTIFVQMQTTTGAHGVWRMQNAGLDAVLSDLRIVNTTLQGKVRLDCMFNYDLELQRQ